MHVESWLDGYVTLEATHFYEADSRQVPRKRMSPAGHMPSLALLPSLTTAGCPYMRRPQATRPLLPPSPLADGPQVCRSGPPDQQHCGAQDVGGEAGRGTWTVLVYWGKAGGEGVHTEGGGRIVLGQL